MRSAFRLLRSQREQAPSPQERFSGVARRSMHAVGATPDIHTLERGCLCGEGACSRWAAQRPQPRYRDLSGGLRSAFRLLRSQREQAPSPQERFGGVARRSMHAVGATPDIHILERECLCGEGACSRWAAQRPQPRHRGLSGRLRSAFRLLRSQREQAPSPQERFSGVARRSMHAVGAPLTSTSWIGNVFVARELAPAGLRSGPRPVTEICQADCVQLLGCCAASGSKLPRHKSGLAVWQEGRCTR